MDRVDGFSKLDVTFITENNVKISIINKKKPTV